MESPGLAQILGSEERISCFDIEIFHLNQRQSRNPRYDEIRESIRAKGIQEPLHIVKHPKQNKWVLSQGGQTRLLICRELSSDGSDGSFLYPPTIKKKYTSDLDLCIDHLIDNSMRGDNTFLETSEAVVNIRNLMTDSTGIEPTQEELVVNMTERGMPIRRQSVTAMIYLAETIKPHIKNSAFISTVSRKTVDGIRSLRKELEATLSGVDFDELLVAFINDSSNGIGLSSIRKYFRTEYYDNTEKKSEDIKIMASEVADIYGLGDVIRDTEYLDAGYLVKLPERIESHKQSDIYFWLISLSGALNGNHSSLIQKEMGLEISTEEPRDVVKAVLDKLEIDNVSLIGLPYRLFSQVDDMSFKKLIGLLVEVRENFNKSNITNLEVQ